MSVDGKRAFVHPKGAGKRADIIPSANVFGTEAEARRFHASDGAEKWVVVFERAGNGLFDKSIPCVVHARVKTFTDEYGNHYKNILEIGRGPRDKRFHTDRYSDWPVFDTAQEAYTFLLERLGKHVREAERDRKTVARRIAALYKLAAEARKFAPKGRRVRGDGKARARRR